MVKVKKIGILFFALAITLTSCGGGKVSTSWAPSTVYSQLSDLQSFDRIKYQSKEFLRDLGGKEVLLASGEEKSVRAIYFDYQLFKERQPELYKKWRSFFKEPRNCKMAELFHVDFDGNSFTTLMGLPRSVHSLKVTRDQRWGVICLPEYGLPLEFDPLFVLNYLARGMAVLLLEYPLVNLNEKNPNIKESGENAVLAASWMMNELHLTNESIVFVGKSFGGAPAIYAASKSSGSHLILDRAFATQAHHSRIALVQGHILIIDAMGDQYNMGEGAKLYAALAHKKEREKSLIRVPGGHHDYYFSNNIASWHEDEKSQHKLNAFLLGLR